MMAHVFDMRTCYCRRCGLGLADAVDQGEPGCDGGGNVVAISHIARGQRLSALLGLPASYAPLRPSLWRGA